MDECMSKTEVEAVLRAEYCLLCLCDDFKKWFGAHVKDLNVLTIPSKSPASGILNHVWTISHVDTQGTEFYFNFQDSILGEILGSETLGGRIIPH